VTTLSEIGGRPLAWAGRLDAWAWASRVTSPTPCSTGARGTGQLSEPLASRGPRAVTGMDSEPDMLARRADGACLT
jgi:hypothetical protein